MYKIFKSKKAVAVDDYIPLMMTLLIFIFLAMFLIVQDTTHDRKEIKTFDEIKDKLEGTDILLTYFQAPLSEGKDTIADLIISSYANDDYSELEKESKIYLDPILSTKEESWILNINHKSLEGIDSKYGYPTRFVTEAFLPLENREIIEIKLFIQELT